MFVLICIVIFAMLLLGNMAHFRAMRILARYGVRGRYFAMLSNVLYMHKTYRLLARQNGWPLWPIYGTFVGFAGVTAGGILIILNALFHLCPIP